MFNTISAHVLINMFSFFPHKLKIEIPKVGNSTGLGEGRRRAYFISYCSIIADKEDVEELTFTVRLEEIIDTSI